MTTTSTAPRQCQCCDRTALWGTASHDAAVDPRNCPRCDHDHAATLTGWSTPFRGADSPVFVAPSPAPTTPLARRVNIYALALLDDAPVSPALPITCGEIAAHELGMLARRSYTAADAARVERTLPDACGVSL